MDKNSVSLEQFFSFKKRVSESRLTELAKSDKFGPVREKIAKELKGIPMPKALIEQMIKQVSDLLNIDLQAIVAGGWGKAGEILEYLDKEKYPPDETFLVPLGDHTIISEHNPSLQIQINEISLGEVQFNINLELTLKGVILKIQNGKIMEASLGSCEGKGSVGYGDFSILEKETEPIALPLTVDFGEGLSIGDSREKAVDSGKNGRTRATKNAESR